MLEQHFNLNRQTDIKFKDDIEHAAKSHEFLYV